MMEGNDCRDSVSIHRYPGPVCSYHLEDGDPVVEQTNDAFDSAFGPASSGEQLTAVFEEYSIKPVDGARPPSALFRTDHQQPVRVGDGTDQESVPGQYLAQVISPDEDEPGHVLFANTAEKHDEFGIDRVASVISHDLRNPLDVAKARLRAGREMDDGGEHLEHVEQAHDRMERIIQDVLTLARGEEVIEPEETADLGDLAKDAWATVETNGASLRVADSLPSTVADRDRVKRLFENLFRNAVEHAGDDVEITVGRVDDQTSGFYVADDGPGIPTDRRSEVFDPGYSSHDHGTGLGLAIVRRIADVHGWSVSVTESADGGARFEMRDVEPA
jgi:signal transduction histidine kinase